jgi:hypothetical protein
MALIICLIVIGVICFIVEAIATFIGTIANITITINCGYYFGEAVFAEINGIIGRGIDSRH